MIDEIKKLEPGSKVAINIYKVDYDVNSEMIK